MNPPRISIIIPAYNQERFLPATLESVRAQTCSDWELVAVDDGSCDGTAAVLEEFSRREPRMRMFRQENRGVSHARNHGLARTDSRSEFVIFLDGDDLWRPEALATLCAALEANPAAPAAHCTAQFIDENNQPNGDLEAALCNRRTITGRRIETLPLAAPTSFAALLVECWLVTPGTCLIRRHALAGNPGFHPEWVRCEDWELWLRIAGQHGGFAFVPRALIDYRRHPAAASTNVQLMQQWRRALMARLLAGDALTPDQRWVLENLHRCQQQFNAERALRHAGEGFRRGKWLQALRETGHALDHCFRALRGPRRPKQPEPA